MFLEEKSISAATSRMDQSTASLFRRSVAIGNHRVCEMLLARGRLVRGRIWAETKYWDVSQTPPIIVEKSQAFIKWYEQIARWIRSQGTRIPSGDYVLPGALTFAMSGGGLCQAVMGNGRAIPAGRFALNARSRPSPVGRVVPIQFRRVRLDAPTLSLVFPFRYAKPVNPGPAGAVIWPSADDACPAACGPP